MAIEFTCTSCGKKMKTGEANAGKKGKCPKCGAIVDIPAQGAAESPLNPPTGGPSSSGLTPLPDSGLTPLPDLSSEQMGAPDPFGVPSSASPDPLGADPNAGMYGQTEQPGYEQSGYPQQPTYEQPTYQQPAYQQPAYQQPAYQQPAYQQPAYQQPGYSPNPYSAPYSPPGYGARTQADGKAVAGMVCGICSLSISVVGGGCCCMSSYFGVIPGIVLHIICLATSGVGLFLSTQAQPSGQKTAGLVLCIVDLVISGLLLLLYLLIIIGFLSFLGYAASQQPGN